MASAALEQTMAEVASTTPGVWTAVPIGSSSGCTVATRTFKRRCSTPMQPLRRLDRSRAGPSGDRAVVMKRDRNHHVALAARRGGRRPRSPARTAATTSGSAGVVSVSGSTRPAYAASATAIRLIRKARQLSMIVHPGPRPTNATQSSCAGQRQTPPPCLVEPRPALVENGCEEAATQDEAAEGQQFDRRRFSAHDAEAAPARRPRPWARDLIERASPARRALAHQNLTKEALMLDHQQRFKVIIGGSGPAAIEAALVLRQLAGALRRDDDRHAGRGVRASADDRPRSVRPVRQHPLSAG